jgi:hypothetical protein
MSRIRQLNEFLDVLTLQHHDQMAPTGTVFDGFTVPVTRPPSRPVGPLTLPFDGTRNTRPKYGQPLTLMGISQRAVAIENRGA